MFWLVSASVSKVVDLAELNGVIHEKDVAFIALQGEIGQMKDFKVLLLHLPTFPISPRQKKKYEMLQEIERLKQELVSTEARHKEIIASIEKKFIEEKIRLQHDADSKISALAGDAHNTAVSNIKETTKEVFKENIKIVEALKYHIQESQMLSRHNLELLSEIQTLREEKEISQVVVQDKVVETKNLEAKVLFEL